MTETVEHAALMRWLLDFDELSLDSLDAGRWDHIREHLRRFGKLRDIGAYPAAWLIAADRGRTAAPPRELRLPRTEIRRLHEGVRRLLRDVRPPDTSAVRGIPYPLVPARISRVSIGGYPESGGRLWRVYGAAWPDRFWLAVVALLEQFGQRLCRCDAEGCGRLFLKTKRQAYCSIACSQRARSRRWYLRNREVALARRHAAYARDVGTRTSAHVRVARRARSTA